MGRKESHGMTGIENQSLLLAHLRQVFHGQTVLGPVLKNRPVAPVGNQLIGVLGHSRVQVIGKHQHNSSCLCRAKGEGMQTACAHFVSGLVAIHIDPAILFQFSSKLMGQDRMVLLRHIA